MDVYKGENNKLVAISSSKSWIIQWRIVLPILLHISGFNFETFKMWKS
jgi:hypothetical protein